MKMRSILARFAISLLSLSVLATSSHALVTINYEYDDQDQLTKVSRSDNATIEYQYDSAGNRTSKQVRLNGGPMVPSTQEFKPDSVYQLTREWQDFKPAWNTLTAVDINLFKLGNPGNLIVELSDSDNVLATTSISASTGWTHVPFSTPIAVSPDKTYRLTVRASQPPNQGNYYWWFGEKNQTYVSGLMNSYLVTHADKSFEFSIRTYGTVADDKKALTVTASVPPGEPEGLIPVSGIGIAVSPADLAGNASGKSQLVRVYDTGTVVTLMAPLHLFEDNQDHILTGWSGCDSESGNTCTVTMDRNREVKPFYYLAPVDGLCGTANGKTFSTTITGSYCANNGPYTISGTGPWTWTCFGLWGGTSSECSAQLDNTPPVVSLIGPLRYSKESSGIIALSASEPVEYFCKLDKGDFVACSAPYTYNNLANGQHTFTLKGRDEAGNWSEPVSHAWEVNSYFAASSAIRLPKTGQTKCFDFLNGEIPCEGTGQDGEFQAGQPWPEPRFKDNGDQTISDNLTLLMWTKNAGSPSVGACGGDSFMTWQGSLDYVKCLNDISYLGYNDWRLPNIIELTSLVNMGATDNSAWLTSQGFISYQYWQQWSSNTAINVDGWYSGAYYSPVAGIDIYPNDSGFFGALAWPVRNVGGISVLPQTGQSKCYNDQNIEIQCAGSGQDGELTSGVMWPGDRFLHNADGTTTDLLTGLIWTTDSMPQLPEICLPPEHIEFTDQFKIVNCLNQNLFLGHNDWRWPNTTELTSLINYGLESKTDWLTSQGFYNVQGDTEYLASNVLSNQFAWEVYLNWGVGQDGGGVATAFWPVRGGGAVFPLSVLKSGNGSGAISSSKAFILWSGNSGVVYLFENTKVVLTATPDPGMTFVKWTGCDSSNGNVCTVTMNDAKNVMATFGDLTPPVINLPPIPPTVTNQTSGDVVFSSNEQATYQCNLDNSGFSPCSSPFNYSGLSNGRHVLIVRATDSAGNVSEVQHVWFVDSSYSLPVPQTLQSLLPKTGQTLCYDENGIEIICAGTGQDGELQIGIEWPNPRFTNLDGALPVVGDILLDKLTGLVWPRDMSTPAYATCSGGSMSWQNALDYIKCLNRSNYLGYNDWRLPNRNELDSLLGIYHASAKSWLVESGFVNLQEDLNKAVCYWSSTTAYDSPYAAVAYEYYTPNSEIFYITDGPFYSTYQFKNELYDSRIYNTLPVRNGGYGLIELPKTGQTKCFDDIGIEIDCAGSGQDGELQIGRAWPEPRFLDNNDGTIIDYLTQIAWSKDGSSPGPEICGSSITKSWTEALNFINCLNVNNWLGYSDWRLPNIIELNSLPHIADFRVYGFINVHDNNHENNIERNWHDYWSSSTTLQTQSAYLGSIGDDYYWPESKLTNDYLVVWPVRKAAGIDFGEKLQLTVTKANNGSGNITTGQGTIIWSGLTGYLQFFKNTIVSLSANPDSSSTFAGWIGCDQVDGTKCIVLIDGPKTVSASFSLLTINGKCGSANGTPATVEPTTGLCSAGTPSGFISSDPWTWTCNGLNGGTDATCATLPYQITFSQKPLPYSNQTSGQIAFNGPLVAQDLLDLSNWNISGTAGMVDEKLSVGGTSGRSFIYSQQAFTQPAVITWKGSFPLNTQVSRSGFAADLQSFFTTNQPGFDSNLYVGHPYKAVSAPMSNGYINGEFTLAWQNNAATLLFNGNKVFEAPFNSPSTNFWFDSSGSVGKPFLVESITAYTVQAESFECSLDGAAFIECTSPFSYSSLTNGPHNLTVRDANGHLASYSWTINSYQVSSSALQLPSTGQTKCFDSWGEEIACTGTGQDGQTLAGISWSESRITDNGDQTMTDTLTGLVWSKDAGTPTVGSCSGGALNWQAALDYVKCLNTGNHLGFSDWRLPNRNELDSLVYNGAMDSVSWLNSSGFTNVLASFEADFYWTSSSFNDPSYAWVMYLVDSFASFADKLESYHVWPVRGGQAGTGTILLPKTGQTSCFAASGAQISCNETGQDGDLQTGVAWPIPRLVNNANTTVSDTLTGLAWLRDAGTPGIGSCVGGALSWQGALDYVKCLNDARYQGFDDWRLPNRVELASLVSLDATSWSWLNANGFANFRSNRYWSASSDSYNNSAAWGVDMSYGGVASYDKGSEYYVLPVRGVIVKQRLIVTRSGSGTGTVTPAYIKWDGSTGTADINPGETVILVATPDAGATVTWSGCDSSDATSCNVTMDAARNVTVSFDLEKLTITKSGNGAAKGQVGASAGTISWLGSTGSYYVRSGDSVTLTASSPSGAAIIWTGCDSTSADGTICTVSVTPQKAVNVDFAVNKLTVSLTGDGSGDVFSSIGNLVKTSTAAKTAEFKPGSTVTLIASPTAGASVTWSDCIEDMNDRNRCSVTMAGDRNVTVYFAKKSPPVVTLKSSENGLTRKTSTVLTFSTTEGAVAITLNGAKKYIASGETLPLPPSGRNSIMATAVDAFGNVGKSDEVVITVDTTCSLTLETLSPIWNQREYTLRGTVEQDPQGVTVSVSGAVVGAVTVSGTSWSCPITGLANGTYTISVTATDQAGNSGTMTGMLNVNIVEAVTLKELTDKRTGGAASLKWEYAGNVSTWRIYTSSSPFTDVTGLTPAYSSIPAVKRDYALNGLVDNAKTYIAVVPVNTDGTLCFSSVSPAEIITTKQGVSGTITDSATGKPLKDVTVSTGTNSAKTDSRGEFNLVGLTSGSKTISIAVVKYTPMNLDITVPVGGMTKQDAALFRIEPSVAMTPLNLVATAGDRSITLKWDPVTEPLLKGYNVYKDGVRANTSNGSIIDSSYKISGLTNGMSYNYTVTSFNQDDVESPPSNIAGATPTAAPPWPPVNMRAVLNCDHSVTLTWQKPSSPNVRGYNIYQSSGATVVYADPFYLDGAGSSIWTSGVLDLGQTYSFAIRSVDNAVEEANTNVVVSITIPDTWNIPRATVSSPTVGSRVDGDSLFVQADVDTSCGTVMPYQILFQYRQSGTQEWNDVPTALVKLPNPATHAPWFTKWDVTGLAAGNYDLRAVASAEVTDPAPGYITFAVDHSLPFITENRNTGGSSTVVAQVESGRDNSVMGAVGKVNFISGALLNDATLTMDAVPQQLVPSGTVNGTGVHLTLSTGQTTFALAVTVSLPYEDADNDGKIDGTGVFVESVVPMTWNGTAQAWEPLDNIEYDLIKKLIKGSTTHFSLFGLVPSSGLPVAEAPAAINVPGTLLSDTFTVSWSEVAGTELRYELQQATNEQFTQNLRTVYNDSAASANISGIGGGTFYYRVRTTMPNYSPSPWTVSAAVAISLNCEAPGTVWIQDSTLIWEGSPTPGVSYVIEADSGSGFQFFAGTSATSISLASLPAGNYSFRVKAVKGGYADSTWTAGESLNTIQNHAPTISGSPITRILAGNAYSFTPAASDFDSDVLMFAVVNLPPWAVFDTYTGTISGAAVTGAYGEISISVSDGNGGMASLPAFTLSVRDGNNLPIISGDPAATIAAGSPYSFLPTASDPDGDPLSFSIANKPYWATFNASTGELTGTPTYANANIYGNIQIAVSDGFEPAFLPAFTLTVSAPGVCGSSNGSAFVVAPSSNLCLYGSPSPVSGLGPWSWTCNGLNGGSAAGCSAALSPPIITSSSNAYLTLGTPGSFTITTLGNSAQTIAYSGILPNGVTFTDNGNGSATISGSPAFGTSGTYTLILDATSAGGVAQKTLVLTVFKAPATVTLGNLSATFDSTPKIASATTTPEGMNVEISYDGTTTAPVNAGSYTVVATISDANYQGSTTGTLIIAKGAQAVSFAPINSITYGAADFGLTATASAGLPVIFTSDNPGVATIIPDGNGNQLVHVVGAGTTTITATQAGSVNYLSVSAMQTLTVNKALIQVSADNISRSQGGGGGPVYTANFSGFVYGDDASVISGLPTFSTDATMDSPAGNYTITPDVSALTAANYSFLAAPGTLAIDRISQTITFNPLATRTYGDASFELAASGGASGNPVTFTSSDPSVAQISGNMLSIVGVGIAVITAYQAGNETYASATAQQILQVNKAILTVKADDKIRAYGQPNSDLTFTISGFVNNEDATILTGTPTLETIADDSSPAGSYEIIMSLNTLATANYNFRLLNGSLGIDRFIQAISFNPISAKIYGDDIFTLSATGGASGNPVIFSSSNPAVATISGNTVTIVGAGVTFITASQAGDNSYLPGINQQILTVNKAPLIVMTNNANRLKGDANPSFNFSLTGFVYNENGTIIKGTPAYFTDAKGGSPVGSYPVIATVGNLYSTNYDFKYVSGNLTVGTQAAITSSSATTFSVGNAGTFSVTATGYPVPTLSYIGTLPAGVSFNASTGVFTGTPLVGTMGSYPVTITASNGMAADYVQNFVLTITQLYTVNTISNVGGSVTPTSQIVNHGAVANMLITPSTGFSIFSVTGCNGTLNNGTYTTGTITDNCTVTVTFFDVQPPDILSFHAAPRPYSLIADITLLANDNSGVVGYCVSDVLEVSSCSWSENPPTSFTFASSGPKELYASAKDAAGNLSLRYGTTLTINLPVLSVALGGTGFGSVNSSPQGIACTASGSGCSAIYPVGTEVSLIATPSTNSVFTSWGGLCSGTSTLCNLQITGNSNVVANFNPLPLVKMVGTTNYFASLTDAYLATTTGMSVTFKLQNHTFFENLVFDRNISATLKGGFEETFGSVTGSTSLHGSLTISDGTVIIDNVVIE